MAKPFKLGLRSNWRLRGVHPDLVRVVRRAITLSAIDFTVLEGLRTLNEQKRLYAIGASDTMNSRHLTGHAVDLGALYKGRVSWHWPLYHEIAITMKAAANLEHVPIEWGGDWKNPKDGPHFQLPWEHYPIIKT